MKRAASAPLLSILMPGLGQLINRQAGKGAILVMATTMLFLGTLALFALKFNHALAAITNEGAHENAYMALRQAMLDQGIGWLIIAGGIYLALLLFSVIDAWRVGRKLDAAPDAPASEA